MSKVVVITGGGGRIAYSLVPLICEGKVFGAGVRIRVRLFDLPLMESKLLGIKMEIEDCGFSLVDEVISTSDPAVALEGADVAVLLGGAPRGPGMERSEMIASNANGIVQQVHTVSYCTHTQLIILILI